MLSKEEISKLKINVFNQCDDETIRLVAEMLKHIDKLEHDKDIMQRALNMQTVGWNKGAKLFADKQKLIEKLEERKTKHRKYIEECRKSGDKIRRGFMDRTS